jgi:hypothetical protein
VNRLRDQRARWRGHVMGTAWARTHGRGHAYLLGVEEQPMPRGPAHALYPAWVATTSDGAVEVLAVPRWFVGDLCVHNHPGCPPVDHGRRSGMGWLNPGGASGRVIHRQRKKGWS